MTAALHDFVRFLARVAVEKHLAAMQQATSSKEMASPQCGEEERRVPDFTHISEEEKHD